jgi:hypothetical protein
MPPFRTKTSRLFSATTVLKLMTLRLVHATTVVPVLVARVLEPGKIMPQTRGLDNKKYSKKIKP